MSDLNGVSVIGRLTKDPQAYYTQDGKPIAKFSVANNRKFGQTESVNFFDISCFGNTANFVLSYMKKGSKVSITGELDQSTWTDNQGVKRISYTIKASSVDGLDPAPQKQQGQYQQQEFQDPWDPANNPGNAQNGGYNQNSGQNANYQQPVQNQPPQGQYEQPKYNKAPAPGGMAPVPNPWG